MKVWYNSGMKIKIPRCTEAQNSQEIIIIKDKKRGCGGGCLLVLLIAGGLIALIYPNMKHASEASHLAAAERRAREADMTPEQKAAREIEKPMIENVQLIFSNAMRENLRDPDSYKPGSYRYHDHPKGYAYFHDYRARNGFGGYNQEVCGLLCATNTGKRVWTFYNQDAVADLLNECGVK